MIQLNKKMQMIGKDMQFEANRKFLGIIIHIDSRYLPRKMSLQISCMPIHCLRNYIVVYACTIDTFQDFLITEHMKPRMHLLAISISLLNHVIVRPTKSPKSAVKKIAKIY